MIHAKYTMVLKNLLDDPKSKQMIDDALSTYPLYTKRSKEEFIPSYIPTREELNKKILNYYKYREIGFETFGRFLDEFEIAMNEIMPKYNLLFVSADQDFNIIYNVDYKRTYDTKRTGTHKDDTTTSDNTTTSGVGKVTSEGETNGTSSGTSSGTDSSTTSNTMDANTKHVKSETPQSELGITAANIDSVDYADQVDWDKSGSTSSGTSSGTTSANTSGTTKDTSTSTSDTTTSGTSASTGSVNNTGESSSNEEILETTKGNYGVVSAQELVRKYRETIINIEQMIINDIRIQELFMLVY